MRKLFYATFEKGFDEIVLKYIKKQDKTSHIKKIYSDSVVFFADDKFNFAKSLFLECYTVYDFTKKEGIGAINAEMKHLLEKKDLKIYFPQSVKKIKLTFSKYNEKMLIDQNLKNAFETMLKKLTKKQLGYFDADAELILMAKEDGDCIFMKKNAVNFELMGIAGVHKISGETALAMNFLSQPEEGEVSLDPFASSGIISYVRSLCFKRANVIANDADLNNVPAIKKLAKSLKDRSFSVLKYDFLSPIFPIHFIDKIVTVPPADKKLFADFIKKAYILKVKKIVILTKIRDVNLAVRGMYKIAESYAIGAEKIYVLDYEK